MLQPCCRKKLLQKQDCYPVKILQRCILLIPGRYWPVFFVLIYQWGILIDVVLSPSAKIRAICGKPRVSLFEILGFLSFHHRAAEYAAFAQPALTQCYALRLPGVLLFSAVGNFQTDTLPVTLIKSAPILSDDQCSTWA
jgi:hypothetical protein